MRIAIIGAGISGLTAAWLLHTRHEVTIHESNGHIGGHTDTHNVVIDGQTLAVDTGFIVFNEHNYPHFCTMLRQLDVAWQASDMSFSVNNRRSGLVYNPSTLPALLRHPGNFLRRDFRTMMSDLRRFYAQTGSMSLQDIPGNVTIAAFLDMHGYSRAFRDEHLYPMCGALWSASAEEAPQLPLRFVLGFFQNHRMLQISDRPAWLTIKGGSARYVDALKQALKVAWADGATAVERHADHVVVKTAQAETRHDLVIFACHADQAITLLSQLTQDEQQILPAFRYRPNRMVLHTDAAVMPAIRSDWASWQVRVDRRPGNQAPAYSFTYWMNRLQNLPTATPVLATLNPSITIDPARILVTRDYEHPVYDRHAFAAQARWAQINGRQRSYFCGAYWGWGFHEDGAHSAHRVVEHLLSHHGAGT